MRASRVEPEAFTAMLTQAGVIHVDDIHEMFDVAQVLIHQPEPKGRRVAIVGNSVQLSALTAQVAEAQGLIITHGPSSVAAEAPVERFARKVAKALADDLVDSVILCFTPPLLGSEQEAIALIDDLAADSDKAMVATMIGTRGVGTARPSRSRCRRRQPPAGTCRSIHDARGRSPGAGGRPTRYAQWRRKDKGEPLSRGGDRPRRGAGDHRRRPGGPGSGA